MLQAELTSRSRFVAVPKVAIAYIPNDIRVPIVFNVFALGETAFILASQKI